MRRWTSHVACFAAGMIVATALVSHGVPRQRRASDRYKTLDTFAEALSYISTHYVDPVDERKMIYGAVDGMVERLDAHSAFLPPRRYRRLREDTEGEFGGVGLTLRDGPHDAVPAYPIVDDVLPGSPAQRAGITRGDRVVSVAGEATATAGTAAPPAVSWHSRLRGRAGSRVRVGVLSGDAERPREYSLVREQVKVPTVERRALPSGVGYIAVRKFQEATASDVAGALVALRDAGSLEALVLDLRANPGGLLDQAIRVADMFLDKGVIVTVRGRRASDTEVEKAHGSGTWEGFPMAVIVDHSSASAAEIVAGALQDHERAKVFGTATYGKGSVQTFLDLEDGSGLKLTTARYYTPSGRSLEGKGIVPDVPVEAFEGDVITVGGDGADAGEPASGQNGGKVAEMLDGDVQLRITYQTVQGWLGSK